MICQKILYRFKWLQRFYSPFLLELLKKNSIFIIFHENCYASLGFAHILLCRALFPDTFYINCDGLEMTIPFRIFNLCKTTIKFRRQCPHNFPVFVIIARTN